jgi:hypothetical protein
MNKNTGVNKMKIGDKVEVKWHKQNEMWLEGVVVGFTPKRIKVDLTWALDFMVKKFTFRTLHPIT